MICDKLRFRAGMAYGPIEWHRSTASEELGALAPILVCIAQARTAIEIGIANGFMTQVFAAALAMRCPGEGVLMSADISEQSCQIGRDTVAPFNVEYEAVCQDSTTIDWAAKLKGHGRTCAEVVCIDGDHSYAAAKADFEALCPLLTPEGFVLAHDYAPSAPGVMKVVHEYRARGWRAICLPEIAGGVYAGALLQPPDAQPVRR